MAWRFEPGERLGDAFLRAAGEEIAKVRAGLTDPEKERDKAVHEARQGFKRMRALLRLAAPSLGPAGREEDRRWRAAGKLLAGSRDRTVLMESFDAVAGACAGLPKGDHQRLRGHVASGAPSPDQAADEPDAGENLRAVLVLLDEADARLGALRWPEDEAALAKGLKLSQKRLRKKWKAALKSDAPDALHDWRKRLKDQSSQLRLFRRVMPPTLKSRRDDEKKTAQLLGEEHDLWMLAERISTESKPARSVARDMMLASIGERREELRREALELGAGFASDKPKAFAHEVLAAWADPPPGKRKPAGRARSTSQAS